MGEYHGKIKADEKAFDSISSVPIWMAHSSDDKVVPVKSDDQFYNALKKPGLMLYTPAGINTGIVCAGIFTEKKNGLTGSSAKANKRSSSCIFGTNPFVSAPR